MKVKFLWILIFLSAGLIIYSLMSPIWVNASNGGDGGTPSDVLIDLGKVIDNVLVPLEFKFSSTSTLGEIVGALIPYLYAIAGIALLLFLIGGGYGFLTSGGDPKKMEAAKNTITLAIIGFLIIIAAYWATQIVNYIFSLGSPIQ